MKIGVKAAHSVIEGGMVRIHIFTFALVGAVDGFLLFANVKKVAVLGNFPNKLSSVR